MKELFTSQEYEQTKSTVLLPLCCYQCNSTFYRAKKYITRVRKDNSGNLKFCNFTCMSAYQARYQVSVSCLYCAKSFFRKKSDVRTSEIFCSRSCSATYHNANKKTGVRRSKLELFLEQELKSFYPNLDILFNDRSAIKSELDIYIPSLSLAFELNGIFHYEPIFGAEKFSQIQNNDNRKFQACIENNISLCILDTSQQKYFKIESSKKFLGIIRNIIESNLLTS